MLKNRKKVKCFLTEFVSINGHRYCGPNILDFDWDGARKKAAIEGKLRSIKELKVIGVLFASIDVNIPGMVPGPNAPELQS